MKEVLERRDGCDCAQLVRVLQLINNGSPPYVGLELPQQGLVTTFLTIVSV